jgi:hypothetical protein
MGRLGRFRGPQFPSGRNSFLSSVASLGCIFPAKMSAN